MSEMLEGLQRQRDQLNASIEQAERLQTAGEEIGRILAGEGPLTVSHSADGTPRVRVLQPDPDMYHFDQEFFVGVAPSATEPDTFVMESHFPHVTRKETYLWKFVPSAGSLLLKLAKGSEEDEGFDLYADPGDRARYFFGQLRAITHPERLTDLELSFNRSRKESYSFQLPELT